MKWMAAVVALLVVACVSPNGSIDTVPTGSTPSATGRPVPAPKIPTEPPGTTVEAAVDGLLENLYTSAWDPSTVGDLVEVGDPRTAWLLADLMRFYQTGPAADALVAGFSELTGAPLDREQVDFVWAVNHLLTWDLPVWDGYSAAKRDVYVPVEPHWAVFFDNDHDVDWRLLTWGGVLADTRPLDDNGPCDCIPALDHPKTTDAAGGDWYHDDRVVFGVVVNGEAIALPKHQMEVHEMVNLSLGGRELGIPYCTLCGSAQAYYTDNVPGAPQVVLRTSGLLRRSNKLMYDLTTGSAIDTFTGEALTGPLADQDVTLEQATVVASSWGDWKKAHPGTRILAEDGGIGRIYADDPLGGRDDSGPIFPIGPVDPRLPVQEKVVGVVTANGTPIAFPVDAVREALTDGVIEYGGVTVRLTDSIRVYDREGNELTSHESFWFAWSQFHRGTLLWDRIGS
jgi:hypothetical protein